MVGAGEMACPVRSREGDRDENVLVWRSFGSRNGQEILSSDAF